MDLASDAVAPEGAIPLEDARNGDHVSPPPRWPEVESTLGLTRGFANVAPHPQPPFVSKTGPALRSERPRQQ